MTYFYIKYYLTLYYTEMLSNYDLDELVKKMGISNF
jgi:hypothetical protein